MAVTLPLMTNTLRRGGAREGSGRPKGTGKYNSPTKTIRVPVDMEDDIATFIDSNGYNIPFYTSMVQAGMPSPVGNNDLPELLNLFDTLIVNPNHTFVVRATGESMINAGINDGDMMVVDRKNPPINGDIVIAALNGEMTVKRLVHTNEGETLLMPENPEFQPIAVRLEDDIKVVGVVRHNIHKL